MPCCARSPSSPAPRPGGATVRPPCRTGWLPTVVRSRARARKLVEASEKVEELPALSGALSEGRLTLDVFVPLATVATPETDAEVARASEHWTPRQARRLAVDGKGATDADAAAQFGRRFVRFDDERCLLWAQLTKDSYALVKAAVVGRARRHDHPSASDPDYVRFESRCADALLDICLERGGRRAALPTVPGAPGSRWSSTPTWTGSSMAMDTATPPSRGSVPFRPRSLAAWRATPT